MDETAISNDFRSVFCFLILYLYAKPLAMKLRDALFPLLITSFLAFDSCKPETVDPNPTPVDPTHPTVTVPTGSAVCLSFENVVGSVPLTLDQTLRYQNMNGDSFSVELFKYYISNISFTDDQGNTWYEPESYHLINAADTNSLKVYVDSMPLANYVSVSYMIGVDSARNVSGTQTGALDPSNGMFWTWTSGYIQAKMEGRSPASTASFDLLVFHIGGFGGQYAGQRMVSPSFNSATAIVTANTVPVIHVKSDLNEWFQSPNTIDFATMSNVSTAGANSVLIADNYVNMFTITSIQN